MPEFLNPFSGTIPERKLTHEESVRAIRLNLAAEHQAIQRLKIGVDQDIPSS